MSMKNKMKRLLALLLAATILASLCSVTAFAKTTVTGTNGKDIYLGWKYYTSRDYTNEAVSLTKGTTYYAKLFFYHNPTTSVADSLCAFDLTFSAENISTEIDNIYQGQSNVANATVNLIDNEIRLHWAYDKGIKDDWNDIRASGVLTVLSFTPLKDVSGSDIYTLIPLKQQDTAGTVSAMFAGSSSVEGAARFNIVELPHFAASVKTGAETLYDTSSKETIKENLDFTFIKADGTTDAVDSTLVEIEKGSVQDGKLTVTATYNGYTCDVEIDVEADEMTGIKVTHDPDKMSYSSGQTLNVDGLKVSAVYMSKTEKELGSGAYSTDPAKNSKLTVAANNNKPITVKVGGFTATTSNLAVSAADISTAVIGDITDAKYDNGQPVTPHPEVTLGDDVLTEGTDYTLTYTNNTTATNDETGPAIITATGVGPEYTGYVTKEFDIGKATGELTLNVSPATITYGNTFSFTDGDGNSIGGARPTDIVIHYRKTGTTEDNIFKFSNPMAVGAGSYEFWAVRPEDPNNDEAKSNEVTVTIKPRSIADEIITITIDPQIYTGSPLTPDVTAIHGTLPLVKDKDYTLSEYKFNVDVTSESNPTSVKVTGEGNYYGERIVNFTINPMNLNDISEKFTSVDLTEKTYTGNPYTPTVPEQVTIDQVTTLYKGKDKDYTVTYGENTNAGTDAGTITIAPVPGSNYTFNEFTKTFTINPVKIKINSSQYDWVPYVDGDKIKGYDSDGGGQQSPYFDYDGKEHGIKLQFKDDARVNEIKLETLVKCTYTNAVNTNASGYTAYVTLKLNKDYETNYQLLGSSDTPVPDRTLTKTWSIHKATLTNLTPPDLNIRCLELAGEKPVDYTYSLDWLGTGVKPNNLKITLKGLNCTGDPSYDNATNTITFPQVTAKKAGTPTDSVELELGFTNYESINVTIPVKYINKLSVSDKLSMANIEVVYGDSYAPVLKLDNTTVTPKTLYKITYTDKDGKPVTNPKDAGTYTIKATYEDDTEETVEGVTYPGHIGEKTATLTIKKRPLTADVKHAAITYGEAVDVNDCTVTFGNLVTGESLTKGTDFTVSTNYKTGNDVGDEYGFFINLQGVAANNYTVPTVTGLLTVNKKSLQGATVTFNDENQIIYDGNEKTPGVTVTVALGNGTTPVLTSNDYTLTYENNTNAGTAKVTVEGKGNYTGKVEKTFKIEKATPTLAITGVKQDATYTGSRFSNTYVQTNNNPSNLEVTYEYYRQDDAECATKVEPIDAGDYKVRISFSGNDNYNAATTTPTVNFTIGRANHPISITAASVTYTGAAYSETNITVTPVCEVTFTYYASETGNEPITRPTDVGTYWVVASYAGTDNYNQSTSARVSFSITKATPPTPAEVKVDGEDKTLKDLEDSMRKDLGSIEGKFTWRDSDGKELPSNTKIEANKEYEWTFTPTGKDAKNYRPIYGKTTPYVRDDLSWLPGVLGGGSTFNFRDVTRYDYFYNAVKWAAENGIASGTSRYTFSPDAVCTRAQTVTFLWRAAGSPMPSYRISPFTDVNYGDYYYNAVLWAVEQGITTGLTATTFGPDKTVTRGQVAMFLYRAASAVKPNITNSFTDVKSTAYNYDAILWAYDNRITTGTSTTTFSPDAFCTRAQIVTFLYRFYQGR